MNTAHHPAREPGLPLAGTRVLEVGQWVTAPLVGQGLAAYGADVIKVEPPAGDPFRAWPDGPSPRFAACNEGTRSLALDLNDQEGRAAFDQLVRSADVVFVAYRDDVVQRLGLTGPALRLLQPKLVYCRIAGAGQGPAGELPGYETIAQATSGVLSTLTDFDSPHAVGPPVIEHLTAHLAVSEILAALLEQRSGGTPADIEMSVLTAGLTLVNEPLAVWQATGRVFGPRSRPAYSQAFTFRCSDDIVIALHLSSVDDYWRAFVEALGQPEYLLNAELFGDRQRRIAHFDEAHEFLEPWVREQPSSHWLAAFAAAGVTAVRANQVSDLLTARQTRDAGVFHPTVAIGQSDGPVRMVTRASRSATRPALVGAPALGAHSREILVSAGLTSDDIDTLVARGAVVENPT